ncbi:acyl-CoA thioesterase [Litoribrevibacter albus]|uniref:Thioesterase n=1 Tax=Litoribrevibacter albus TaxID=1473156 RepID=A0AA37SBZ3_9GAMM|nr:thioesterase family protein [Litoribrevibacter albus]GLQ32604.1 thioesterase [Litoribrevibacter albus]
MHIYRTQVTDQDLDHNHHVNNVVYIQWMQNAAEDHGQTAGIIELSDKDNGTWFVREHNIVYKQPAMPGDEVMIETWIENIKGFQSLRKYEIKRTSDQVLLASAYTNWVYVDKDQGKPKKIPAEFKNMFNCPA